MLDKVYSTRLGWRYTTAHKKKKKLKKIRSFVLHIKLAGTDIYKKKDSQTQRQNDRQKEFTGNIYMHSAKLDT